jgi:hypothetical protein
LGEANLTRRGRLTTPFPPRFITWIQKRLPGHAPPEKASELSDSPLNPPEVGRGAMITPVSCLILAQSRGSRVECDAIGRIVARVVVSIIQPYERDHNT